MHSGYMSIRRISSSLARLSSASGNISEQVTGEGIADSDRAVAKRVFDAMMQMGKIDVAKIEAARRPLLAAHHDARSYALWQPGQPNCISFSRKNDLVDNQIERSVISTNVVD